MFRVAGFVLLMLSTSAVAESGVVDLSKPQIDDFRSTIDLRGDPNLKPQDGNPIRQVERPVLPAVQPQQTMALANTGSGHDEASAAASAKDASRSNGSRVGVVYIGLGHNNAGANSQALKEKAAAPSGKRSFRLGRRR